MVDQATKLGLLKSFLNKPYYCDMTVVRDREQIETVSVTCQRYIEWGQENIPSPSSLFIAAVMAGQTVIAECQAVIDADDYSDLSGIANALAELRAKVDLLVAV